MTQDVAVLWFSSGGSSSVLHYDDRENINCLVSGTKDWTLLSSKHHADAGFFAAVVDQDEPDTGYSGGGFSALDVDAVDMSEEKYARLREAAVWKPVECLQ